MEHQKESTSEEIQKRTEEFISKQIEVQKIKNISKGKPGPKSEIEKQIESLINNI